MQARKRDGREPGRRWSVALVSVAGVTIRLHVTFLALVLLVALTANDAGESVVAAVGWLGVLFACVLAHELAHTVVARSKGVVVREIDLLPIGGVSRLESIPKDWRHESAIAAAGPMASVAIALLAFLFATIAGQPLVPADLGGGPLLVRLGWVNLVLAAFNLIPAFPLDGGRVLRALFERHRSRREATRRAARISTALAAAMIGLGLLFNVWLVLIGFFVVIAAKAEEAAVLIHDALGSVPVSAIAVPCPVVLRSDMAAIDAARLADGHLQPAYPVADAEGRLIGLVTPAELRRSRPGTTAGELASGPSVDAGDPIEDVSATMAEGPVAVTSQGRLVGVTTPAILDGYLRRRLHEVDTPPS